MDRIKEERLRDEFPLFFVDLYGDPTKTCLSMGLNCGDGWYDLIHNLCLKLREIEPGATFKIDQIKEKFGGLRFYCSGYPVDDRQKADFIRGVITQAEKESYSVCQACGSTENVSLYGSWIRSLCDVCGAKHGDRRKTGLIADIEF